MRSRQWMLERRAAALVNMIEDTPEFKLRKFFTIDSGDLVVTCRRSTFFSEDDAFKSRDFEMVCRRDKAILAMAKFREWASCGGFSDDFFLSADASSQSDCELAEMLAEHWHEDEHPLCQGDALILFDRLVIAEPHSGVWPALKAAMDKAFVRRRGMIALKAFPLEWEGAAQGRSVSTEPEFARRLSAMRTLYRRRLAARDIPGNDDGWMWIAIGNVLPPKAAAASRELIGDLLDG